MSIETFHGVDYRYHSFGGWNYRTKKDSRLDKLFLELKQEFPKLIICPKNSVWYQYIIHILVCIVTLGFNRNYLKGFTTTFTNRIHLSKNMFQDIRFDGPSYQDDVWITLSHERVHLRQFKRYGFILMLLMYVFPPFLLAYGRYKIELPAYLESLSCQFEVNEEYAKSSEYRNWWVSQFTGPKYGWMWIIKSGIGYQFDIKLWNEITKKNIS